MFWLAAPIAMFAGKALYDAFTDDDDDDYRDNRREVQDEYDNSKKESIANDIEEFKNNSVRNLKKKFNAKIEFVSKNIKDADVNISVAFAMFGNKSGIIEATVKIVSKDTAIKNNIKKLKKETDDVQKLLVELEALRNETTR